MVSTLFTILPVLLSAIYCSASSDHGPNSRSRTNTHRDLAKRIGIQVGDLGLLNDVKNLITRARFTFYDVGLGACGQTNVESDFIVALNENQFGGGYPGPNCFKTITIKYKGKSANAKIMDKCPGCPYGGLDLSRGLFRHFASEGEGVIYGEWHYGTDSGGSPGSPADAGHHGGTGPSTVPSKPDKPTSTYFTHRPESVHAPVKPPSNTPIATRVALQTHWPMPDGQVAKSTSLPSTTSTSTHWQTSLPFSWQAFHTTLLHNSIARDNNARNVTTSTVNGTVTIVPQATTSTTANSISTSSFKDATSAMSTEVDTINSSDENLVALTNVLGRLGQMAAMARSST